MIRITISLTSLVAASVLAIGAEPLTEQTFPELMKEANAANRRFRTTVAAEDAATVGKDAKRIAEIFTLMAAFWQSHKLEKAVKWSEESAAAAKAVAASVEAKDWEKVREQVRGITANCKNCHDVHREKVGDDYKIKF